MRIATGKRSLFLLALAAFLIALAAPAFATITCSSIESLSGDPNLGGSRAEYRVTLQPSTATVDLVLTATGIIDSTAAGSQIRWTVTPGKDNITTQATINGNQSSATTFDSKGSSRCFVQFFGPAASDTFTIRGVLQDANNNPVSAADVMVNVSFGTSATTLTGVTLDKGTLSFVIGESPIYLKATPVPGTATDVTYTWTSTYPSVARVEQVTASPDMALVTPLTAGQTRVVVSAKQSGATAVTASCDVTVSSTSGGNDDLSENMRIPAEGSTEETDATLLYALNQSYIQYLHGTNGATRIVNSSGMGSDANLRYIYGAGGLSPVPTVNTNRRVIATDLGLDRYRENVAAALTLDLTMSDEMTRGDMVPFALVFDFDYLYYADGETRAKIPATATEFHDEYRLIKFFERNSQTHQIDLSDLMDRKSTNHDYARITNGGVRIVPLIVMVDGRAPEEGCDERTGTNLEYGVRYDKDNEILFIYDGSPNKRIADPIVLEKREYWSSGGGGGCDAGFGILSLLALAGIALAPRRNRS